MLRRYFTLHAADREEVGRCRGAATTLGFAVQLCTLRWRGHFLRNMVGVPAAAIEALAEQLGLLPLALEASLRGYLANEDTRLDHHERIRRHLGFVRCGPAERRRLLDHMVATARAVPRAATLYSLACRWLLEQHIVRPGPSTMRDILARAREQALAATFEVLTAGLTAEQRDQLDQLLLPPEAQDGSPASVRSRLDGFRAPAPGVSAAALVMLTEHLGELHGLGFARWPALGSVHPATRRLLAGWGYAYDAWSLRRFEPAKRHAVLICTLEAALAEATDALVEMQDKLITRVHNRARIVVWLAAAAGIAITLTVVSIPLSRAAALGRGRGFSSPTETSPRSSCPSAVSGWSRSSAGCLLRGRHERTPGCVPARQRADRCRHRNPGHERGPDRRRFVLFDEALPRGARGALQIAALHLHRRQRRPPRKPRGGATR